MKNNGFTVFGNERDREAVLTILDYVSESLSFADKKVCAFIDGFEEGAVLHRAGVVPVYYADQCDP